MEYTRINPEHYTSALPKALKTKDVTFLWGEDGWCYVPELNIRQKYTKDTYIFEFWDGVISIPEHVEEVTWTLYSESPRLWKEESSEFCQLFEQKVSNQKQNNRKNVQRAPRRQHQQPSESQV